MNRQHILEQLGDRYGVKEIENLCVRYTFDYSLQEHEFNGHPFLELGRNDVDIPIVMDPETSKIYFLDERGVWFINSDFTRMIATFEAINDWWVSNELPDAQRAEQFTNKMLSIDAECFKDPNGCWTFMREEIESGVIQLSMNFGQAGRLPLC